MNAAIANSDGATQKNAELVKVAGQSTSTLNEYAVSLLRSVSTFNLGTREYGSVEEAEAMVKDAIVFASAPESVMVQMLLQTPGIRLFDVLHADAYSRRFPFLTPVALPRGVVDLARDLLQADVRLIPPTATLVAREDTHPALIQLFMQAAQTVHGGARWFQP